jgi:hypothetical protein
MGNNAIFESVVNHNASRMAPPGAVLEAYMTLTAPLRNNSACLPPIPPARAYFVRTYAYCNSNTDRYTHPSTYAGSAASS